MRPTTIATATATGSDAGRYRHACRWPYGDERGDYGMRRGGCETSCSYISAFYVLVVRQEKREEKVGGGEVL